MRKMIILLALVQGFMASAYAVDVQVCTFKNVRSTDQQYKIDVIPKPFWIKQGYPAKVEISQTRITDGYVATLVFENDLHSWGLQTRLLDWGSGETSNAMWTGFRSVAFRFHGVAGSISCAPAQLDYAFLRNRENYDREVERGESGELINVFTANTETESLRFRLHDSCVAGSVDQAMKDLKATKHFGEKQNTLHLKDGKIAFNEDEFVKCSSIVRTGYEDEEECLGPIYNINAIEVVVPNCQ